MKRVDIIKPGKFSVQVAADHCRDEFDCKNEVIIANKVAVDFVFIGDSITEMWEPEVYFGKVGKIFVNRGIGSDVSAYVLKRFEADVVQLKPKYCIMKIGVNDTSALEDDFFHNTPGASPEAIEERLLKNIEEIMKLAQKGGLNLIVCSILPTNIRFNSKNKERNLLISSANRKIKALCDENNLVYVDYHSKFVMEDGLTVLDGLTYEGCHPHVVGYNIMAEVLRETLAAHNIEI